MKHYLNWASREYSLAKRLALLVPLAFFFLLLLPYGLYAASAALDKRLALANFASAPITHIAGLAIAAAGFALALWSIYVQMDIGRGTPVPMVPTQALVVQAPFTYCRNPMTLGTILGYGGIGVWLGSWSALGIVLLLGALLMVYIKRVEEQELAARFGDAYREYKQRTPFILPRLRGR